jgi:hypothetical protein
MTAAIVASAIFRIFQQTPAGPNAEQEERAFFRLDGFDDAVYRALCDLFKTRQQVAGRPTIVRVTRSLGPNYESFDLEEGRTATSYRNSVPPGHALVLIFNKITTDRQSLSNLFIINESLVANKYLDILIEATFNETQLSSVERKQLRDFVRALNSVREPQLRSLVSFLEGVHDSVKLRETLAKAIGTALPAVQLFRSTKVAQLLSQRKSPTLLIKKINAAANHTLQSMDVDKLLQRMDAIVFESDQNMSETAKRRAIGDYLRGSDMKSALEIDWSEIELLLSKRTSGPRKKKRDLVDQLRDLGAQMRESLEAKQPLAFLEPEQQEALEHLLDGQLPDPEAVEDLLEANGKYLGTRLLRQAADLLNIGKPLETEDFPLGVTTLAIKLLSPFQIIPPNMQLSVRTISKNANSEVLEAFKVLYGGINALMPVIQWELPTGVNSAPQAEDDTDGNELHFEVTLNGPNGVENRAELHWRFRAGSPLYDFVLSVVGLRQTIAQGRVPIPIFSGRASSLVPDVTNISQTLGSWWESPAYDVRQEWLAGPDRRRGIDLSATHEIAKQMEALEVAFADLLMGASYGVLLTISSLLDAYNHLLAAVGQHLKTDQEITLATDLINRAWTINDSEHRWLIVPLLHPIKLIWYLNRIRHFNDLLFQLAKPGQEPAAVDMNWLQRDVRHRYSSAYFPAVMIYGDGNSHMFLPSEESDGLELFRPAVSAQGYIGTASNLDSADRAALKIAAEHVVRSLEAYLEAHPFAKAGMEVLLANVQAPSLPIEILKQVGRRINLTLTVHSPEHAASIFTVLNDWVNQNESLRVRDEQSYFPTVRVRVQEGNLKGLVQDHRYDMVVLVDALSNTGQEVAFKSGTPGEDQSLEMFLPFYQPLLNPFADGAARREVSLTPPQLPPVVRRFYASQAANKAPHEQPLSGDHPINFTRVLRLGGWPDTLKLLHERAVWVVCYDINADRFLLEHTAEREYLHIIRYVQGLGPKKMHNLTVSSSFRAREEVVRRMAQRLDSLLPDLAKEFRQDLGRSLVDRAQELSGGVVLKAAGPGTMLNELLGLVMAKHQVEERIRSAWPNCLVTWVYLDDYKEWFGRGGKRPDMLAVAARLTEDARLELRLCVVEAKCVNRESVDTEHSDALKQVIRGTTALQRAFQPGSPFVDSEHWYRQLYQAIVSNLEFKSSDHVVVEALTQIQTGNYHLSLTGEAWVFGYDDPGVGSDSTQIWEEEKGFLYGFKVDRRGVRQTLNRLLRKTRNDAPELPEESLPEPQMYLPEPIARAPQKRADRVDATSKDQTVTARADTERSKTTVHETENTEPTPVDQPATSTTSDISLDGEVPPALDTDTKEATLALESRDLLVEYDARGDEASAMLYARECMEKALRFLKRFDQRVSAADYLVGPRVIRIKLNLLIDKTSNFKNVTTHKTNLRLELKLNTEPYIQVGNDGTIWVDIPRPQPAIVGLKPLLNGVGSPALPPETRFPLGLTMDGTPFIADLRKVPHWLVGGTSGSGKSIFLRSVLLSLMLTNTPESIQFVIIDPKGDLIAFRDSPFILEYVHTRLQLAEQAIVVLKKVMRQLNERLELMVNKHMVNEIDDYHRMEGKVTLPRIVVLIEEYGDLISNNEHSKELASLVEQIAAIGRAPGVHLFICTQNPVVKTVSTDIKANCSGRVALWVKTAVNSQVILDEQGAEDLLKNGDMLYKSDGPTVRIQAPFVDNLSELQPILKDLAARYGAQ